MSTCPFFFLFPELHQDHGIGASAPTDIWSELISTMIFRITISICNEVYKQYIYITHYFLK
jgi:hypothetical protein